MGQRLDLHEIFEEILGSENVYFQPPPNLEMKYPAIVYKRDTAVTEFADNKPYSHKKRYAATYIDRNPDSEIPDKIAALPLCVFSRHFATDGLNHDIYTIYF